MKPEEFSRIITTLPRGYSFIIYQGQHIHTCLKSGLIGKNHPAYSPNCGKCWQESQEGM